MRICQTLVGSLIVASAHLSNLASASAAEGPESSANMLEKQILAGADVHVVVELNRCKDPVSGEAGPSVVGVLRPDGFMLKPDHSIAFAVTHFTVRSDGSPMDEFLSFKVEPDGKVLTSTVLLNAATYSTAHRSTFECNIGAGVEFKYR